jgi:hypothetical protein
MAKDPRCLWFLRAGRTEALGLPLADRRQRRARPTAHPGLATPDPAARHRPQPGRCSRVRLRHPADRPRGIPILAIRHYPGTPLDSELTRLAWAPHGQPATLAGPDGQFTGSSITPWLRPTPTAATSRPPTPRSAAASVVCSLAYQPDASPPATPKPTGRASHPALRLPAPTSGCCHRPARPTLSRNFARSGFHPRRSHPLWNGVAGLGQWRSTSFSYSPLGETRWTWDNVSTIHLVRDAGRRQHEVTDLRGTTTRVTYSIRAFPGSHHNPPHNDGTQIGETYQEFDEGRVHLRLPDR